MACIKLNDELQELRASNTIMQRKEAERLLFADVNIARETFFHGHKPMPLGP